MANSADPDQTPHSAASDQGLHGLQIVQPICFQNISITEPDIPKIEIRIFQYIVGGGMHSVYNGLNNFERDIKHQIIIIIIR